MVECNRSNVETKKEGEYQIYYIDNSETKLVSEAYEAESTTKEELITELLIKLNSVAYDAPLKKAIPDNIPLPKVEYIGETQIRLFWENTYSYEMSGIQELLRRAAIVKTLCQIVNVRMVEFYVGELPLTDIDGKVVGAMSANNFMESSNYEQ